MGVFVLDFSLFFVLPSHMGVDFSETPPPPQIGVFPFGFPLAP